jgi:hypothetical protein
MIHNRRLVHTSKYFMDGCYLTALWNTETYSMKDSFSLSLPFCRILRGSYERGFLLYANSLTGVCVCGVCVCVCVCVGVGVCVCVICVWCVCVLCVCVCGFVFVWCVFMVCVWCVCVCVCVGVAWRLGYSDCICESGRIRETDICKDLITLNLHVFWDIIAVSTRKYLPTFPSIVLRGSNSQERALLWSWKQPVVRNVRNIIIRYSSKSWGSGSSATTLW